MPELPEVEAYRRLAAAAALDRPVAAVHAPDEWILKGGLTPDEVVAALAGRRFVGARRIGKLLLLDTSDGGPVLGLRFGMTGRLVVDGRHGVEALAYSSNRDDVAVWDRFGVRFADGGSMLLRDPRRLGGVTLDPPEDHLGHDALTLSASRLAALLAGSRVAVKARLMDQAHVAGIGNLLADEMLWRAGIDPARPAASLSAAEARRLHRHLRATVDDLLARGGSHTGDLHEARMRGGRCPRDGAELLRRTVGGRTTYSCPRHQR